MAVAELLLKGEHLVCLHVSHSCQSALAFTVLAMALMAMASPFARIQANGNKGRIGLSAIADTACFLHEQEHGFFSGLDSEVVASLPHNGFASIPTRLSVVSM